MHICMLLEKVSVVGILTIFIFLNVLLAGVFLARVCSSASEG